VHEDLTTVITGEEAESFIGVIPLDLASRHEQTLYNEENWWARTCSGIQAIGPGHLASDVRIELTRQNRIYRASPRSRELKHTPVRSIATPD
jgi:hypothetical protein